MQSRLEGRLRANTDRNVTRPSAGWATARSSRDSDNPRTSRDHLLRSIADSFNQVTLQGVGGYMSNTTVPQPHSRGRSSRENWKAIALGVIAALIATVLVAVFAAAFSAFSKLNEGNAGAFRALLAFAFIAAAAALATLVASVLYGRSQITTRTAILDHLISLESSIARIDWSYDSAEHERRVYERMRRMVSDPRTKEFKIVSLFRNPKSDEVSDPQREAIIEYYTALEDNLAKRRGFVYERMVVIRGALGEERTPQDLVTTLMLTRPEFAKHCREVAKPIGHAVDAHADIKFYGDTGRLLDVAFAVALDAQGQPITLVLEIGRASCRERV